MSIHPKPPDSRTTRFEVEVPGARVSIAGPALAVITLVALVGMIWLSIRLVDLNERVILQPNTQLLKREK